MRTDRRFTRSPLLERLGAGFFARLPSRPGVYFMLGRQGELLYIGKAKSLRARLFSYKRAQRGQVPDRIMTLLSRVREIRWEEHPDERSARLRENELLHAARPPFNIQSTEELHYLFIGLCERRPLPLKDGRVRFEFHLTSGEDERGPGISEGELFGCYRHRPRTKQGYVALLRLLTAGAAPAGRRFNFPAVLCRDSTPWRHEIALPAEWRTPLREFLSGRSLRLLRDVFERVVLNEAVPRFMYPALRDDLGLVREFYRFGPCGTRRIRAAAGKRGPLPREAMDELIASELEAALERGHGRPSH